MAGALSVICLPGRTSESPAATAAQTSTFHQRIASNRAVLCAADTAERRRCSLSTPLAIVSASSAPLSGMPAGVCCWHRSGLRRQTTPTPSRRETIPGLFLCKLTFLKPLLYSLVILEVELSTLKNPGTGIFEPKINSLGIFEPFLKSSG